MNSLEAKMSQSFGTREICKLDPRSSFQRGPATVGTMSHEWHQPHGAPTTCANLVLPVKGFPGMIPLLTRSRLTTDG